MAQTRALRPDRPASSAAVLEVLKPITWFPPAWAFACGAVAAGGTGPVLWGRVLAGMILAGPLVCGASQAMNDWCDRHVDAINQPDRPIPSGRLPGNSGLIVATTASGVAIIYAAMLGWLVLAAAALALLAGWAYSAPPLRLKANGWRGPLVTGLSYEGLAWLTGALVVAGGAALSRPMLVPLALLYSLGAFGIMTLNDFKAIEGDRTMGIASLPVKLGPRRAAHVACLAMIVPQMIVVTIIAVAGMPMRALVVLALVAAQLALMPRLLRDPERFAPWFNGTGVLLFVSGMMVAAFAVRAGAAG